MLVHIAICVCMHQYLGCCLGPSKELTLQYTESKDIDVGIENKN